MDGDSCRLRSPVWPVFSGQCVGDEWVFSDVPSDIIIEVNGRSFMLHMFPLVTRSGRIRKLVEDLKDPDCLKLELNNVPGGVQSFELAAKFCYGMTFEITTSNVACLCCISEYLEMTDEYCQGNLATCVETYLDEVVLKSLEKSVEVLRQCETLLPLAEELNIVGRCINAIASIAYAEQMNSRLSKFEHNISYRKLCISNQVKNDSCDWWMEELSVLCLELYQKVISAMRCRGLHSETIAGSLMNYAQKELSKRTKFWNLYGHTNIDAVASVEYDQILLVETITSLLPTERLAVPVSYLFGLLRTATMLECTIACRRDLERRIASQLDMATLDDLLMPLFRHAGDTLFDVDTVHRILVIFFQQDDGDVDFDNDSVCQSDNNFPSQAAVFKVSKLLDSYLAEIAPDVNLKLTKFMAIIESLPGYARLVGDGLYRAIDIYIKDHPGLSELERRKLCKLIDFQKLSPDAAGHAAQNERLPVQSVVQVLYFEQLRLRNALYAPLPDEDQKTCRSRRIGSDSLSAAMSPRDNYASLRRENRDLKLELTRLRMRLNDLEKDHMSMKEGLAKSSSQKFLSTFSWTFNKLSLFGSRTSTRSTSPSKLSQEPRYKRNGKIQRKLSPS